jgi:hypothetical protein
MKSDALDTLPGTNIFLTCEFESLSFNAEDEHETKDAFLARAFSAASKLRCLAEVEN